MRVLILASLGALAIVSSAMAEPLILEGRGKIARVSAAQIAAMPHRQIQVNQHGREHLFSGVPLSALLAQVGVSLSQPLSGKDLASAVRVTARDGYQVVLSLSELDPATRSGDVLVADGDHGKPLAEAEGPLRLVVADDLRPARSARQITRIEVLELATSIKAAGAHP